MRLKVFFSLMLIAALFTQSGCTTTEAKTTPVKKSIFGAWMLSAVDHGNLSVKDTTGKITFTLKLSQDGTASGVVACNRWHSKYQLSGNNLKLAPAATTRKMCIISDPVVKKLERQYLAALQESVSYVRQGQKLILTLKSGETWIFDALFTVDP